MNKAIIYLITFMISFNIVMAASISREMPGRVSPNEEGTVIFKIKDMEIGKEAGISEVVPVGIVVTSYSITGAADSPKYEIKGSNHKWSFEAASKTPTVTYKFTAKEIGTYEFDAVYALPPSNIGNIDSRLTVRVVKCGDNVCEGNENKDKFCIP